MSHLTSSMAVCANLSCNTTIETTKKCGRCRAVSYCDQKCQREDFSLHKQWCKAAHDAIGCGDCKTVSEALPGVICLHYVGNHPESGILDDPTDKFAIVFHAPFSDRISKQVERIGGRFDMIVQYSGADTYTRGKTMALAACPKCQSNVCGSCIRQLDNHSVHTELLCNFCQTKDRVAKTLADGSIVCSGCLKPLVKHKLFPCPSCRNPLRYTGQLDGL